MHVIDKLFILALDGGATVQIDAGGEHQLDGAVELRAGLAQVTALIRLHSALISCVNLAEQFLLRVWRDRNLGHRKSRPETGTQGSERSERFELQQGWRRRRGWLRSLLFLLPTELRSSRTGH